jgi:hypothetical protein
MATVYKVLNQVNPSATTETTLYTPSGAASAVVSTITVCNQAASSATYRIAVWPSGTSSSVAKNWIVYGATVAANDTTTLTLGMTLENGATIRVYASTSTVSFNAFGSEIS